MGLLMGADAAKLYGQLLANSSLHLPSEAVLSRSRLKVDVVISLVQRERLHDPGRYFFYLSADSSPQAGLDYLMTLQDAVLRHLNCLRNLMSLGI